MSEKRFEFRGELLVDTGNWRARIDTFQGSYMASTMTIELTGDTDTDAAHVERLVDAAMDSLAVKLRKLVAGAVLLVALVALAACGATPASSGPDGSGSVVQPSRDAGVPRHFDGGVTCDATPDATPDAPADVTPDATSQRCAPPRNDVTCPHDCCPWPIDGGTP